MAQALAWGADVSPLPDGEVVPHRFKEGDASPLSQGKFKGEVANLPTCGPLLILPPALKPRSEAGIPDMAGVR